MRLFRCGDAVLRQKSGLAIGGPLRSAGLQCCLARVERFFDFQHWLKWSRARGLAISRKKVIATARYVDDIFLVSRFCSASCMAGFVNTTYGSTVSFEEVDASPYTYNNTTVAKFLDFFVHTNGNNCWITPACKNEAYALTGCEKLICKRHYPHPSGTDRVQTQRLIQDLKSRLARLHQLKVVYYQFVICLWLEFNEIIHTSYRVCVLQCAWTRACTDGVKLHAGLDIIDRIRSSLCNRPPQPPPTPSPSHPTPPLCLAPRRPF